MSDLWTPEELAAGLDARAEGGVRPSGGASIDTRTLAPGDLFFALKGERDGHDFVASALEKGAAAAVIDAAHAPALAGKGPLLVVDDVLAGMERLGRAARARVDARICAVTGSVGKTGTKEALRHVLAGQGATHASVASYNNHWGVPLTLCRMPRDTRYGVFEIGMSAPDEIRPLARMVRPHVAIVTIVEPVHIEAFPAVDAIADAKGEIFAGLEPGGVAIVNRDNAFWGRLSAHAMAGPAGRVVTFGRDEKADIRALSIALEPDGSRVEASLYGRPLAYRLGSPGQHNALNSLAVLAAVHALGADVEAAAAALAELKPVAGRGLRRVVRLPAGGEVLLVDDAYNANPASMRAALTTFAALPVPKGGRRIAVLGDMLELGPRSAEWHADLAGPVDEAKVDLVFASGSEMAHLYAALPASRQGAHAPDAATLEPKVLASLKAGDLVMVKGSKGSLVSRIVAAIAALDAGGQA